MNGKRLTLLLSVIIIPMTGCGEEIEGIQCGEIICSQEMRCLDGKCLVDWTKYDWTENTMPFTEAYPTPKSVTYTTQNGEKATITAYPGLITIIAKPDVNQQEIEKIVALVNGEIVRAIPIVGSYWIKVSPGIEESVINQLNQNPAIIFAAPLVPLMPRQENANVTSGCHNISIPNNVNAIVADTWATDHGPTVAGITSQCDGRFIESTNYDLHCDINNDGVIDNNDGDIAADKTEPLILEVITVNQKKGKKDQKVIPINFSFSAMTEFNDCQDRRGCNTPECRSAKMSLFIWWYNELAFLENLYKKDPSAINYILITFAASNDGLDITDELAILKTDFPHAWKHVIFVSTTEKPDQVCNSADSLDAILYADEEATSYATPKFTCLVAAVAQERSDLTADQIKEAIIAAAPVVSLKRTLPNVDQVLATVDKLYPKEEDEDDDDLDDTNGDVCKLANSYVDNCNQCCAGGSCDPIGDGRYYCQLFANPGSPCDYTSNCAGGCLANKVCVDNSDVSDENGVPDFCWGEGELAKICPLGSEAETTCDEYWEGGEQETHCTTCCKQICLLLGQSPLIDNPYGLSCCPGLVPDKNTVYDDCKAVSGALCLADYVCLSGKCVPGPKKAVCE